MSTPANEEIEKVVIEALETFGADPGEIASGATLQALDIDSLDLAELSQIVEERFGVALKGSDVAEIKTVGDAVKMIAARV